MVALIGTDNGSGEAAALVIDMAADQLKQAELVVSIVPYGGEVGEIAAAVDNREIEIGATGRGDHMTRR